MTPTYLVHWCVIQFDKEITQLMERPLKAHHGFLCQGTLALRHCTSKANAEAKRDEAIADMKAQSKTGRAYIITAHQFSQGITKYNVTPNVVGDIANKIVGTEQGWTTFFPVTEEQIKESVSF